jgi:hypothetical protein
VNAIVRYERAIAFGAGAVMTSVSVYYLVFVFELPKQLFSS